MLCAVIGNPIAHSRSPEMYQAFARQLSVTLDYQRILAPVDQFDEAVKQFRQQGGTALNVTVPFKRQAYALSDTQSDIVQLTKSASLLLLNNDGTLHADNFDGLGLVNDIEKNWGFPIKDKRLLLLGAGGAAYGCLPLMLEKQPASLVVANRTVDKLAALKQHFPQIDIAGFDDLHDHQFDLLINGTSSSLQQSHLPIPASVFHSSLYCYDMAYDPHQLTHFLSDCSSAGVQHLRDGLGMLIEQGAQAFYGWFGEKPETHSLINNRTWLL